MVNLDNVSFIEDSHGKKAVILALKDYQKIQNQLEELEDIKSYIQHKEHPEDTLPFELVQDLLDSNNSKVKLFRQYKGLTISELAKAAGITESYLSQIENFRRKGTVDIYKKLANILDIDMDLIT
jgi:ribosome-binding protein aMBF1 (putative translation factor)